MKPHPQDPQSNEDQDDVWKLIAKAPARTASPYFAQKTVKMAMETPQAKPWWVGWWSQPLALGGLAAATAAIALTLTGVLQPADPNPPSTGIAQQTTPETHSIQDLVESEMLLAASDNLSEFTDQELASLVGF